MTPILSPGRRSAGTLALTVDERGHLRWRHHRARNSDNPDLVLAPMQRGDINQSSFCISAASLRDGEEWYRDEDVVIREITRFSRLLMRQPCDISGVSGGRFCRPPHESPAGVSARG